MYEILSFAAKWRELENIMLSKKKPDTERVALYACSHVEAKRSPLGCTVVIAREGKCMC
jgi:hypothetical protein